MKNQPRKKKHVGRRKAMKVGPLCLDKGQVQLTNIRPFSTLWFEMAQMDPNGLKPKFVKLAHFPPTFSVSEKI